MPLSTFHETQHLVFILNISNKMVPGTKLGRFSLGKEGQPSELNIKANQKDINLINIKGQDE